MARFLFRQGIARRQSDGFGNGANLQPSNGGSYIDLIVSPDPTVFIIAHFDSDYQLTENASVVKAWGPFTAGTDYWIYWDVDFITGELTRGYTILEPVDGATPPPSPGTDQHWFDTANMVQKVWTGSSWIEKLRLFAAKYQNGATLIYQPIGSHVSVSGFTVYAGAPLFDPDGKPLQQFQRNRRGKFVTTETDLHSQFSRISNFRVEAAIVQGEAAENIPISHIVSYSDYDTLVLADNNDINKTAIGIATEDMNLGEIRSYITKGFLTDEVNFDWSSYPAGTPLFVGPSGLILPAPDGSALTQQTVGIVINQNTIFVNIQSQILLEPAFGNEMVYHIDRDTGAIVARQNVGITLDALKDVNVPSPMDGDAIVWDDTAGEWVLSSTCCGGGSANMYKHVESSLTYTWNIIHNAGSEDFVVDVFDETNELIIPDRVTPISINSAQIEFNSPQSGKAIFAFLV